MVSGTLRIHAPVVPTLASIQECTCSCKADPEEFPDQKPGPATGWVFYSAYGHRCAADPCASNATVGRPQESAPAGALQIRKNPRNGWPSAREAADFLQLTRPPARCGSLRRVVPPLSSIQEYVCSCRADPEEPPARQLTFFSSLGRWHAADSCASSSTTGRPQECTCSCGANPEELSERMAKRPRGS